MWVRVGAVLVQLLVEHLVHEASRIVRHEDRHQLRHGQVPVVGVGPQAQLVGHVGGVEGLAAQGVTAEEGLALGFGQNAIPDGHPVDEHVGPAEDERLHIEVSRRIDGGDDELDRRIERVALLVEVVEFEVARVVPRLVVGQVLVGAAQGEVRILAAFFALAHGQHRVVPLAGDDGEFVEGGLCRNAAQVAGRSDQLELGVAHVGGVLRVFDNAQGEVA